MTTAIKTPPALMRAKQACELLAISRWSLDRLAEAGAVRTVKLLSQKRFVAEDIEMLADPEHVRDVRLLTPIAAARMIGGITSKTICRMADAGRVRSVRTPSGQRRVYADDIRKLIDAAQGGSSDAGTESRQGRDTADQG